MDGFTGYAKELESLISGIASPREGSPAAVLALSESVHDRLRADVPLHLRRQHGAFFTGKSLAKLVAGPEWLGNIPDTIIDPACGGGDLLLALASRLPVGRSLSETISIWESRLRGHDLEPEFVRVARSRLTLLAWSRTTNKNDPPPEESFKTISIQNGLTSNWDEEEMRPGAVILNPPFSGTEAPNNCSWATGKVSTAALFVNCCIDRMGPGTRLVAILPEVLRSGTRYHRWRQWVERRAIVQKIEPMGRFDQHADIHVFLCQLQIRNKQITRGNRNTWISLTPCRRSVGDFFDTWTGPVVEHRHPKRGQRHPYAHPRICKAWGTMGTDSLDNRRFKGRTFTPPFVVIRRTSRPEDQFRIVPTVIKGETRVAVENHLIVLCPHDATLASCRALVKHLKQPDSSEWMNKRLRCRHLTVQAVRELPWDGRSSKNHRSCHARL